ncbi:MAG: XdhC family protein [Pirellulales bacterium]|nr:XdhC family protein [Pirellulales bacterium]
MRELVRQLIEIVESGREAVYCRLVETRGSTPQKAGACMLVLADGSQAGTLGGGCVEAEVKRQALARLAKGQASVERFSLDHDYGWDDGLICGGRMHVLVQPVRSPSELAYFRALDELLSAGATCQEAIVFDSNAATGCRAPACWLFDEHDRQVAASCGAPEIAPAAVVDGLLDLHDRPRIRAAHGIAWLPQLPRCRLLIVGGGHVGLAVAKWASELDFRVWVLDDRAEFVSAERFPSAERRICGPIGRTLADLEITPDTYAIIVTRGHNHDEEALRHLAERGARYVGMIGSRRKIKLIFDDLLDQGVSAETLARVYAPLGIDIGSQTVAEIAVSIVAELVAHRNRHGEVPGRPAAVDVAQCD